MSKNFGYVYGETTGIFVDGDEIRIGKEPSEQIQGAWRYFVVLSTGRGGFPIRFMTMDGQKAEFETYEEALKAI